MADFDPELALPTLAVELLPAPMIGIMLAGLFAATMSTADSQILSCTAAIRQDLLPERFRTYGITKWCTLLVTAFTLYIALNGNESVFALVMIAWSALTAAFAPLLFVLVLKRPLKESTALVMMIVGISAMLWWRSQGYQTWMLEAAPGLFAGLAAYALNPFLPHWSSRETRSDGEKTATKQQSKAFTKQV